VGSLEIGGLAISGDHAAGVAYRHAAARRQRLQFIGMQAAQSPQYREHRHLRRFTVAVVYFQCDAKALFLQGRGIDAIG